MPQDVTHTAGPWRVALWGDKSINGAAIIGANGLVLARVPRVADRPYYQKEADARLLAAAPDLLAALKFALTDDAGFACPASTEAVMLAAIDEAEGR